MRIPRPLTAAAALLATALAGAPVLVSPADAAPDGDRSAVDRAADRYGVSDQDLRAMLAADRDLHVAGAGLYYTDPAPDGDPEPPRVLAEAFPLGDTFSLHSKPGSLRTIYLDFNGHLVSNTWWNQAPTNLASGQHPAWTLDADPSSFNDTERLWIQDVFLRVAEDYAPFDVDVTTEDPGEAAIIRNGPADLTYGTRALVTPSNSAHNTICPGGCGGVAFIDVFDDPNLNGLGQPAFVFPHKLANNSKWVADALTHEVGHNLSLMHDGTTTQGYYSGHGNLWGPIMGAPYDYPVSQWALSDYPGAKLGGPGGDPEGLQPNPDDIATISASGTPFRTDEAGTSIANAPAVPSTPAFISNRTDVDYYRLGTCSGSVTVTANNAEVGPNLDLELQLLGPTGTVIDTDNPPASPQSPTVANGLDATVSGAGLASATYYVRVDGVGPGNPTTGYTDYGSVGAYTLQVSGCGGGGVDPGQQTPSAPQNLTGQYLGQASVMLQWTAPLSNGGAAITHYNVYEDGVKIGEAPPDSTGGVVSQVASGIHEYGVAAVNSVGEGARALVVVDATDGPAPAKPGQPVIGQAKQGRSGKPLTAKITWAPPTGVTDPPITGYQVIAFRENKKGKFKALKPSKWFGKKANKVVFTTTSRARIKFAVRARNSVGIGMWSPKSNAVRPQ